VVVAENRQPHFWRLRGEAASRCEAWFLVFGLGGGVKPGLRFSASFVTPPGITGGPGGVEGLASRATPSGSRFAAKGGIAYTGTQAGPVGFVFGL
jgi:hypothetical protein